MSTSAGTLTIDIEARVARLEEGMTKASRSVKRATDDMSKALATARTAFVSVAATLGVGAFSRAIIESGARLDDLSQRLGVSARNLSAYEYAAKLGGASSDTLTTSLTRLSANMQEAAINQTGKAAKTFAAMGVSVLDASGKLKATDQVFAELSARMERAPDGAAKTAAAIALLGKSGSELIPTMNNLAAATAEAERLGVVVSNDFVKQAAQFDDSLDRMKEGLGKFGRQIASDMLPAMNSLIDRINVAMGAQENLSLQTLERDRAALMAHYVALRQSGMKSTWAEAQAIEQRIHALDEKIVAANKRLLAFKDGPTKTGISIQPDDAKRDADEMNRVADAIKRQVDPTHALNAALEQYDSLLAKNKINSEQWAEASFQAWEKFHKAMGADTAVDELLRVEAEQEAATQAFINGVNKRGAALMTESERANAEYQQRLIDLENFYVMSDMTDEEYRRRKEELENRSELTLTEIRRRNLEQRQAIWRAAWKGDMASVASVFGEVSDLMQSSSRKQFEIGKKAAIAQSLINTSLSVTEGLKTQPFFPVGLAMGALAFTKGMIEVNKIKAQSFGGGGGGGSSGGAVGTYPASPNTGLPTQQPGLPQTQNESRGNTVQIIIEGNVIGSDEYVNGTLIPAIANAVNNNDVVLINSNSRNAREIVGA